MEVSGLQGAQRAAITRASPGGMVDVACGSISPVGEERYANMAMPPGPGMSMAVMIIMDDIMNIRDLMVMSPMIGARNVRPGRDVA